MKKIKVQVRLFDEKSPLKDSMGKAYKLAEVEAEKVSENLCIHRKFDNLCEGGFSEHYFTLSHIGTGYSLLGKGLKASLKLAAKDFLEVHDFGFKDIFDVPVEIRRKMGAVKKKWEEEMEEDNYRF